jgi:carbon monoxide dehydrogenase subunit G
MRIEDSFSVHARAERVYETLLDLGRVAPCVPGAEIVGQDSEDAYAAAIRIKIGPMTMQYRGDVTIVERDPVARRAVMRVEAQEARGLGTVAATAEVTVAQAADGAATGALAVDVALSGKAASLGQGAIRDVSAKIVRTFAANLEAMLAAEAEAPSAAAAPADASAPTGALAAAPATPSAPEAPDALSGLELARTMAVGRLRQRGVALGLLGLAVAFLLGRRSVR